MRTRRRWRVFYKCVYAGQVISGLLAIAFASALKTNPDSTILATVAVWMQERAWPLLPIATALVGVLGYLRRWIGAPWEWEAVQTVLDQLRDHVFAHKTDPVHYHRATLFRYRPWRLCLRRWPTSGWLVAEVRSGYTTQKSGVVFKAPDDADRAEGVAGQAWARNRPVSVWSLPDLGTATPEEFDDYAKRTWVTRKWLEREGSSARSFCAIPVELRGTPWGVIVLDSRSPDLIREEDYQVVFSMVARILSKLLARG